MGCFERTHSQSKTPPFSPLRKRLPLLMSPWLFLMLHHTPLAETPRSLLSQVSPCLVCLPLFILLSTHPKCTAPSIQKQLTHFPTLSSTMSDVRHMNGACLNDCGPTFGVLLSSKKATTFPFWFGIWFGWCCIDSYSNIGHMDEHEL